MSEGLKTAGKAVLAGMLGAGVIALSQVAASKITSNYGKGGLATAVAIVGGGAVALLNPLAGVMVATTSGTQAANSFYAAATAAAVPATPAAPAAPALTQGLVQGLIGGRSRANVAS